MAGGGFLYDVEIPSRDGDMPALMVLRVDHWHLSVDYPAARVAQLEAELEEAREEIDNLAERLRNATQADHLDLLRCLANVTMGGSAGLSYFNSGSGHWTAVVKYPNEEPISVEASTGPEAVGYLADDCLKQATDRVAAGRTRLDNAEKRLADVREALGRQ